MRSGSIARTVPIRVDDALIVPVRRVQYRVGRGRTNRGAVGIQKEEPPAVLNQGFLPFLPIAFVVMPSRCGVLQHAGGIDQRGLAVHSFPTPEPDLFVRGIQLVQPLNVEPGRSANRVRQVEVTAAARVRIP